MGSRTTVTTGGSTGPSTIIASSEGLEGSPIPFFATARLYVFVEDNFFSPADLSVTAGTTVTWNWADAFAPHNVAPDATQPARSGDPVTAPHQYSFTFDTPGTYRYYCEVHGGPNGTGMSGIIEVTP
jgi:plastocyanin